MITLFIIFALMVGLISVSTIMYGKTMMSEKDIEEVEEREFKKLLVI